MSCIKKMFSQKGKPLVVRCGYIYTLKRQTATKCIFRCQDRDCKGKLTI